MTWLEQVGAAALSSHETLQTTFKLAMTACLNNIPGDFVECGVFGGAQCAVMAKAIMSTGAKKRVHLFDSFEGIPEAGPNDKGWSHAAGQSACSLEAVKSMMKQWGIPDELLVYHPGWFHETVAAMMQTPIAILRLDADLYESTRVCLEHLYPLVVPGGWLIVDDFALAGCRQAVLEYFPVGHPGPAYFQKQP